MIPVQRLTFLVSMTMLLGACAQGPRDVEIGLEECAHCRMIVSEERFAAQLRTEQGRSHVFDAIECMADFVAGASDTEIRALWVTDFTTPGLWVPVDEAYFLRSDQLRSPMGMGLSAYLAEADARSHYSEYGGEVLRWAEVLTAVANRGVAGAGHSHVH
jgi:copper chaperone NosL